VSAARRSTARWNEGCRNGKRLLYREIRGAAVLVVDAAEPVAPPPARG